MSQMPTSTSSSAPSSRASSRVPSSSNNRRSGSGDHPPTTPKEDVQQGQQDSARSSRARSSSRASSAAASRGTSSSCSSKGRGRINDRSPIDTINKREHTDGDGTADDLNPPPAINKEDELSASRPVSQNGNSSRAVTAPIKEGGDTSVAASRTHSSVSSVSPIVDSADDEKDDAETENEDVTKKSPNISSPLSKINNIVEDVKARSVSKGSSHTVSPSRTSALATTKKKVTTIVTTAANVAALRPPPKRTTIGSKTTTTTTSTVARRGVGGAGSMGTSSRWGVNNNHNSRRAISGSFTTATTVSSPSAHFPTKIVMAVNLANRSRPSRRYREGITSKVAAGILTSKQLKVRINHLERQEGRARNESLVKKEKQEMIAIQRWVDVSMAYVTQVRNGLLDRRMVRGPAPLVIYVGDDTDDEKLRGTLLRVNRPVGKSPIPPPIEGEDNDAVTYKGTGAWHQYRHNTNLQKRTAGAAVARDRHNNRGDAVVLAQGGPASSFLRGGRKDMDRSKSVPMRKPQPPPRQPPTKTTTTNTSIRSKSGPAALDSSARSRSIDRTTTTTTVPRKAVPKSSQPRKNSIANHRHQRMLLQQREGLGGQEFMKRNQLENEERASIKAIASDCFPEFVLDVDFVDFTRYVQHRRAWADELKAHRAAVLESSDVPLYPLPQIPLAVYQGLARFEGLHGHTTADAVEKAVAMVEEGKPTATSSSSSSRIPLQEAVLERLQLILSYAQYRYRRRMTSIANKREPSQDGDTSSSGGDYDLDVTSVGSSAYGSRASSAVGSDTSGGDNNSPKHHRRHSRRRRSSVHTVAKKRKSIADRAGAAADVVLQSNAKAPLLPVRRYRGRLPTEEPTMPVTSRRRSFTNATTSSRSPSRGPTPRKLSVAEIQPFGCVSDPPAVAGGPNASPPVSSSSSTPRVRRVSLPEEQLEMVVEPTAAAIFTSAAPEQPPAPSEDEEDGSPLPRRPKRQASGSPHDHSPPQIKSATVSPSRNVSHSKSQSTTAAVTSTSAAPATHKNGKKLLSHNHTNEKVISKSTFLSRIATTTPPKKKEAPPAAPPKRSPARKMAISPTPAKESSVKKEEAPPPPPLPPKEKVEVVKQEIAVEEVEEKAAEAPPPPPPPPPPVVAAASANQTPITTARSSRRHSMQSSFLPTTPSAPSSRASSVRPRSISRSSSRRSRSSSRPRSSSSSSRRRSSVASSRATSSARSSSQPTTAPSRVVPSAGHSPPTSANRHHRRRNGDREEVTVVDAPPVRSSHTGPIPRNHYEGDVVIETTVFANRSTSRDSGDNTVVDEDEYYKPVQRKKSTTNTQQSRKSSTAKKGGGLTSYEDGDVRGSSDSSEEGRQRHPAGFTSFANSKTPTPPTSSRDGRRGRPGAVGSGPAPLVSAPVVRQR